ncbi:tetratricopeptide repeat protein [Aeromonas veronii]
MLLSDRHAWEYAMDAFDEWDGEAEAQYNLGWMYARGFGVEQDMPQAEFWCSKAAERGYSGEADGEPYNLSERYNIAHAVLRCRKAAEQGNIEAQYNLGGRYRTGLGVTQDITKAVVWYRKAGEQGHAIAQFNLGFMYRTGQGVEQDMAQAVVWYRKAAENWVAGAQYNLGLMYHAGMGVELDDKLAYVWCSVAATNGHLDAINKREIFAKRLSPMSLVEANLLVNQYTSAYQPRQ